MPVKKFLFEFNSNSFGFKGFVRWINPSLQRFILYSKTVASAHKWKLLGCLYVHTVFGVEYSSE